MSILLLEFSRARPLKKVVKLLMKFVKPGNKATFCFWEGRASLHAFSHDGRIQSFVHFDASLFSQYICYRFCSYTLNIDEFNAVVNLAANSSSVSIHGTASNEFRLAVQHVQTFELQVFSMEFDMNPLPKAYKSTIMKAGSETRIFKPILDYLANFKSDNVVVTVMPEEVTFAIEHHLFILSRERLECKIIGDPSAYPHVTNFSWEHLVSKLLKKAFGMMSFVGIYLPGPDKGAPPAIFSNVPSIGRIMFYFRSEDDDDDGSPAAKKPKLNEGLFS